MRCDFRGTETTATWHWSDGTTSAAVSGADAVKSGLGDGNHDHYLIISNGAALTRFGAAGGGGNGHLASITGFEKCTHLGVLYAYNESSLSALGHPEYNPDQGIPPHGNRVVRCGDESDICRCRGNDCNKRNDVVQQSRHRRK
jgi:hypothetical protein